MDTIYFGDDLVKEEISFDDVTDETPILRSPRRKRGSRTKWCCFVLIGLFLLAAIVSSLVLFDGNVVDQIIRTSDPDSPLSPSSMPMGVYEKAGIVSTGLPCAQIGIKVAMLYRTVARVRRLKHVIAMAALNSEEFFILNIFVDFVFRDVLSRGGNVVDAAIATMLCDGAQCPQCMGVGGGFIMSVYNATTKKIMAINAREIAPASATTAMFVKDPKNSVHGGLAVAVPGAIKGYSTIYNLYGGGVPWKSLFEPTIKLCEEGMKVSKSLETSLKNFEHLIKNDTILRQTLFDEELGRVKKSGETYKLPELAKTLMIVAKEGADAIYNGSLTSQLVEDIKKAGGIITEDDLASYKVEIEEAFPVNLKNGYTVHVGPPPGSGIILAYILRILDGMLPAPDAGLDAHRLVEAFKFAYGERSHLGDHRFVNVSEIYEKVKSDSYINTVRSKISDNFTSLDPKYYGADFYAPDDDGTANIALTDSMGNTVVVTSTINTNFGSGFVSPSTGIVLNDEMDDFSTPGVVNYYRLPSSPSNFIKPGKRPMSSMCPTIITDKNGGLVLGVGAAGGSKITLATAYVTALKLWHNKTLKESIDEPRIYHQLMPMEIHYEYGVTKDVIEKLQAIGHPVKRLKNKLGSAASAIAKSSLGMIEVMPDFRRPGNSSGY